ncbi:hypothetical protein [Streptomyces sp. NBC_00091]|uniref:hypothetical protein n=1 Tax=Streptomyces sp. NBC_00091 TaxID=2975648 RepID=UPI00225A6CB7|nr:hypothetical protein [Streptomyces sp. NBC_00091]MCX5380842.1 hypothetical protein [Streptomyces sp. NBC_00091]
MPSPRPRRLPRSASARPPGPVAHDVRWAGERRSALGVASLLLAALFTMDAGLGELDVARVLLWTGLACLVFVILLPPRVCVRPGLLSVRRVFRADSVRTDSLVSVQWSDGVAQRVVLRDAQGGRVEIDPAVLVRNPPMWRRLDADSRTSITHGTLRHGATALRELADRIDRETAHTVFKVSGLD